MSVQRAHPRIARAARSAINMTGALVFPEVAVGIAEAEQHHDAHTEDEGVPLVVQFTIFRQLGRAVESGNSLDVCLLHRPI